MGRRQWLGRGVEEWRSAEGVEGFGGNCVEGRGRGSRYDEHGGGPTRHRRLTVGLRRVCLCLVAKIGGSIVRSISVISASLQSLCDRVSTDTIQPNHRAGSRLTQQAQILGRGKIVALRHCETFISLLITIPSLSTIQCLSVPLRLNASTAFAPPHVQSVLHPSCYMSIQMKSLPADSP